MTTRDISRVDEMQELRFVAKWTLQEIADKFNITRERVRQLLGNTGSGFQVARRQEIADKNKTVTNSKLAQLLGFDAISPASLSRYRKGVRHEIEGGAMKIGTEIEDYVSKILNSKNIRHQQMPHHHPFDILLDNGLRIDVKTCNPMDGITKITPMYSFNLHQDTRGRYADYFICVLYDTKDIFVIPASETRLTSPVRFAYPEAKMGKKSKWLQYHNRFDLLKKGQTIIK